MEPRAYLCAYLEARYLSEHAELTPAARELVHSDVRTRPEKYAQTDHAQALLAYTRAHEQLIAALASFDDLSDEEFERRRAQLFGEARGTFGRHRPRRPALRGRAAYDDPSCRRAHRCGPRRPP